VGVHQRLGVAGDLNPAARQDDQVVGDPFQFGQDVRGQHYRHPVLGDRGHHRGHERVPGHRVKRRQRLV